MYVVKTSKYNLKYCAKAIIVQFYALLRRMLFLFSSEFYKSAKGLAISHFIFSNGNIFLNIEKTQ